MKKTVQSYETKNMQLSSAAIQCVGKSVIVGKVGKGEDGVGTGNSLDALSLVLWPSQACGLSIDHRP